MHTIQAEEMPVLLTIIQMQPHDAQMHFKGIQRRTEENQMHPGEKHRQ
ncbi:MAG: hypothetical protein JXN64_05820 [Spirochaetes bacterium]|nr:hypothetical protein [Spirochaetota bacterium]